MQEDSQERTDSTAGGASVFKAGVQEVEFQVRVGLAQFQPRSRGLSKRGDKRWKTQSCKIVCKQGTWIGPLCRDSKGKFVHYNKQLIED